MKKIFFYIFVILSSFFISTITYSFDDPVQVANEKSPVIFHDGLFGDGYPYRTMLTDDKLRRYFWGNWDSSKGYANFSSFQTKGFRVLTELGMIPKKVLKSWGVKKFKKVGRKTSFKSSGNPAVIQLYSIDGRSCFVVISKFGAKRDAQNRVSTGIDGYICKYNGDFTIDDAINFTHCVELKGDGNTAAKKIDIDCIRAK